jgi:hypothetical protein
MKRKNSFSFVLVLGLVLMGVLVSGCSKDSATGPGSSPSVNMAVSFSKAGTPGLLKGYGVTATDSLRIDSAVVVLSRIKFESRVDTVKADTTEGAPDDDRNLEVTFKGPFVIHVRDTVGINFANQVLPAGTYDGIKFKIHKLQNGEKHEDSDDRNHRPHVGDSAVVGSSITLWGSVKKNGLWTPFKFTFNGEIEFKIKGSFTIESSTSSINIALNFNIGSWFQNPQTGALLDPTDISSGNRELIKRAIYNSFGKGRGGHDHNGDGHPDD